MQTSVNKLIQFFAPEHYDLTLDIDRVGRKFSGKVVISGSQTGDEIRLHAKDLEIKVAKINDQIVSVTQSDNDEIIIGEKRGYGDCEIEIDFAGVITDGEMHGLYPCFYEINGEKHEIIATQFESHHAREVFPCVDEPTAKATFDVTLTTETDVEVLGNMPIDSQAATDKLRTKFETTPRMSTYLLAFAYGDLQKKSGQTKSGVEVNVFASPAQPANSLDFALETSIRVIEFFNDYFGVEYPLPKSDHVALPDFSSGAMENWGLVTYRETCLLVDENAAFSTKQYVATVIAHELSHQWFGNLVTMEWWNDLWLNESFASPMEYVATDALFPDWNMWLTNETSDVIAALRRDALPGVQPVRQDVNHPDEISTLFDGAIVYAKGGRLLKMLRAFVGEDDFRKGLQSYFKKHAYQNTSAEDLWTEISAASGENISELMNPWLTRPGYPVVFAEFDGENVTLRQQQFLLTGETTSETWPIPLFASDVNVPELMAESEISFTPANIENFQLNRENEAHFITAYDATILENLRDEITDLPIVDRLKLLNEMAMLVRPGLANTADLLDFVLSYDDETSDAVWDIISMALGDIRRFVETNADAEKNLRKIVGHLARKQYDRLGWTPKTGEPEDDHKLRVTIISQMLYAENPETIERALQTYIDAAGDFAKIDGELRPVILSAAVRHGENDEFHEILAQYKLTQNADLKQDLCSALASAKKPHEIDELISILTNTEIIKPQDNATWFVWLLGNRFARDKTWSWMCENWDWITETFGGDKSFDAYPRYAGARLQTRQELEQFELFFLDKIGEPSLRRAIEVGITDITARVAWLERDRADVIARINSIR